MPRYPKEFKESIIQKMMPPNAVSVSKLAKETGVTDTTLYNWRKEYRNQGVAVPADNSNPENWSVEDKLAVVVESMPLNEAEFGEYCRSKGLYAEQVEQWKQAALTGYKNTVQVTQQVSPDHKKAQKKIKKLEAELNRKEKALAETAALLVLSKKCQAIWGETEED
jgi:transposase-like protein